MGSPPPDWQHFDHDADMGVRAVAESQEKLFEQMALGMTAIVAEPSRIRALENVEIECKAPSLGLLLVDWLNALIYEMAVRGMLFGRFRVTIDDGTLQGIASGEKVDPARHQPAVEVKGATYTALGVQKRDDGLWEAQCVVDV